MENGTATMANRTEAPQKIRMGLSYDPATPLVDIYPKSLKTFPHKDTPTPMFIVALFM